MTPEQQAHKIAVESMAHYIDDETPPSAESFRKTYNILYDSALTKILEAEEEKSKTIN